MSLSKTSKWMKQTRREEIGEMIKGVFLKHQPSAFRTDLDIKTLDCLRYMEEEILLVIEKELGEI